MKIPILVVDDEKVFLKSIKRIMMAEGYDDLTLLSDPFEVEKVITETEFATALLDVRLPGLDGLQLLEMIQEKSPQTECIMVTADDKTPTVVRALKQGAYDYLVKPIAPERLLHTLNRALEHWRMMHSIQLRSKGLVPGTLDRPDVFEQIITNDDQMTRLLIETELHAQTDIPILITGETGVGKELLAKAVHVSSPKADGPFLSVNMLTISPLLFESEFFGHVRGAFTGAHRDHRGYLKEAKSGTIFLDEIGDLSLELQGKLLRILQEAEYVPVGKSKPEKSDVRFVAATNIDLEQAVRENRFRMDLYYRLQFARLHIPPLRERKEDIPILVDHILDTVDKEIRLSDEAMQQLMSHDFSGNVRELIGILKSASNLVRKGAIEPHHLRIKTLKSFEKQLRPQDNGNGSWGNSSTDEMVPLAKIEKVHILSVYDKTNRNKRKTARVLGIGIRTLYRRLEEYGVD